MAKFSLVLALHGQPGGAYYSWRVSYIRPRFRSEYVECREQRPTRRCRGASNPWIDEATVDALEFDNLLERYRPYLTLLARAHLDTRFQRRLDASDVVQQTMLEAHQHHHQFRGSGDEALGGWLRKMLVHNCADAIRAMGREKRDIGREKPLEAAIDASFCRVESWLMTDQSSPSQQVAKQEELLAMARAVDVLPVDQREAVILHHLQGMKLSDLAGHFGRSEAAVAGLLARGLRQLRVSLGASRGADPSHPWNEHAGS